VSAQDELKRQLLAAIRAWVLAEGLSQRAAAQRLNIPQPAVSEIMQGHSRYAAGWLLDAWVACGGRWRLELERQ
jgi:predicted XRE-type DNA-binding protein